MEKGEPIRFVTGVYEGLIGWRNAAKKKKKGSDRIPVIVQLEKARTNSAEVLHAARVKITSCRKRHSDPKSKEEAAIQQHPDLEKDMINCTRKWSEIGTVDNNKVLQLFGNELVTAQKQQLQLKGKARYRSVEFPRKKRSANDDEDMSIDITL